MAPLLRRALRGCYSIFSPSFMGLNPRIAAVTTTATLRRLISSSQQEAARAADENLSRLLQAKINAQGKEANRGSFVIPKGFRFKIIDKLGDDRITLKRYKFGEEIRVIVFNDWPISKEEKEKGNENSFCLYISIDKGKEKYLKLDGVLSPKSSSFHSIHLKPYQGSDGTKEYNESGLRSMDKGWSTACKKYLKARGIDSSFVEFLDKYFSYKREREYSNWLKNVVDFIRM